MTGLVSPLPARLSGRRWALCFGLVASLHFSAGAAVLLWPPSTAPAPPPAVAILVELAPAPAAPPDPVSDIPPGPEQVKTPPPAPKPKARPDPVPEIEPDPPVIETAEAVLPPAPEPEPERVDPLEPEEAPQEMETENAPPEPAAPETTAPPSSQAPPDETAAAPIDGAPSLAPAATPATWQSILLGHLERNKRYPQKAQRRRQEGVVHIRFTMDRQGNVLSRQIEQGSGFRLLDAEALALIDRAQPLPPPPPEIQGEMIELVVPVEFFLG